MAQAYQCDVCGGLYVRYVVQPMGRYWKGSSTKVAVQVDTHYYQTLVEV